MAMCQQGSQGSDGRDGRKPHLEEPQVRLAEYLENIFDFCKEGVASELGSPSGARWTNTVARQLWCFICWHDAPHRLKIACAVCNTALFTIKSSWEKLLTSCWGYQAGQRHATEAEYGNDRDAH